MKKILAFCGTLAGSFAVFAEGSTSTVVDTTTVTTLLSGIQTNLSSFATSALPVLGTIAGAFMVFWLGGVIIRLVKRWANKAG